MFDLFSLLKKAKQLFKITDILIVLGLIIVYFATRLVNITKFPIFSDEGIYIHWAKVAWHDASWRFISLTDGKQPLQTWGTIPLLKLFPDNALFAGRLFGVLTGFAALLGIFSLLYYLFGKKTACIGSLLYIFTPYFLFYDRFALVDSGVNAATIWILFFTIVLAETIRLDISLIYGLLCGLALLAKSSVRIFLGMGVFAPILFLEKKTKNFLAKLVNFVFLYGISSLIALVIYNVQRLSPFFHYVAEKNKTFIVTPQELLKAPFMYFWGNIKDIPLFFSWEAGFILIVFGFIGWPLLYKRNKRLALYIAIWVIIPYIVIAFVTKVLFPRYIIFFASLFLIPAAYFLATVKNKFLLIATTLFFVTSFIYFDYPILFNFKNLPFPPVDRGQYVESWTAGWGIKDIMNYARQKSKDKPVVILADGNFGLAGDVLDTYLKRNDRIEIRGYWPLGLPQFLENQKDLKNKYVYVVMAHELSYPSSWPLKLIQRYDKPGGKSVIYLFELTK